MKITPSQRINLLSEMTSPPTNLRGGLRKSERKSYDTEKKKQKKENI